ncbi:MAG: hypothetical protein AB7N71_11730 [Phycisphaerae bacterium]
MRIWRTRFVGVALTAGLLAFGGCKQGKGAKANATTANGGNAVVDAHKPEYKFAESVRVEQPEMVRFLRGFLETCMSGDYEEYRRYVSRQEQPETRDKFRKIYDAINLLTVTEIHEIEHPRYPKPTYRVVSEAEFVEGKEPVFGEDRREIAILVFKEEGEWRIVPAPAKLQPQRHRDREENAPSSAPSETKVDYPWESLGDG